jgi:hypothetical protein
MIPATRFTKTISWLLAAALVVQPVSGFSCGCSPAGANAATQSVKHRCCCRSSADRAQGCYCCRSAEGGKMSNAPRETCCSRQPARDNPASSAAACRCGSGVPVAPPATPAERTQSEDLMAPVLCACLATMDAPTVHQRDWAFSRATDWASASEHCIALGRLLI